MSKRLLENIDRMERSSNIIEKDSHGNTVVGLLYGWSHRYGCRIYCETRFCSFRSMGMYGHHVQQTGHQRLSRSDEQGNNIIYFPVRSRLRIWSRVTASAILSRASPFILHTRTESLKRPERNLDIVIRNTRPLEKSTSLYVRVLWV